MSNKVLSERIRVVGLCGSLRKKSFTRMALQIALKGASQLNVEAELIDLREYDLPFCDDSQEVYNKPDVLRLSQIIKASQGIILASPEYHGSFTGVLKNSLDLMGFKEFQGKIIGLLGVAGGSLGAINALNGLRTVGRQLRSWVIPTQVSIPHVSSAFDNHESLVDNQIEARVLNLGRDVAKYSFLHHSSQAARFVTEWEKASINPGGEKDVYSQ